jgi:hypothetical protein
VGVGTPCTTTTISGVGVGGGGGIGGGVGGGRRGGRGRRVLWMKTALAKESFGTHLFDDAEVAAFEPGDHVDVAHGFFFYLFLSFGRVVIQVSVSVDGTSILLAPNVNIEQAQGGGLA